mmetsp:Transcript_58839/g.127283  ORF Transcript_58839/g.127283 Transcript_58839/m.127283 type:complete len:167 (+) Transcript_58839:128-628(+)
MTDDANPKVGGKGGLDTVNAIRIWKDVIQKEMRTSAEWEGNWGFLKAPVRVRRGNAQAQAQRSGGDQMPKSASTPALGLAAAGQAVITQSGGTQNASVGSLGAYDPEILQDDRFRVLAKRQSQVPRDRFLRPATTQQELGWRRPSLERFGVSHFGFKRNQELWPEI